MTLKDLQANQRARIKHIHTPELKLVQRLRELGIVEGREILCMKRPPFGGPGIYQMGASTFSIDLELASQVELES